MKTLILSAVLMMAATAGAQETPAVTCRLDNDRILKSEDGSINETIAGQNIEVSTLVESVMVKVTGKNGKTILVAMGKEYVIAATEKISISCKVRN